jgi:hypothetical protein
MKINQTRSSSDIEMRTDMITIYLLIMRLEKGGWVISLYVDRW